MNTYWLEQSQSDVPLTDEWLSNNEHTRLDTIRFPKRRADWRLGRWTAKRAIAEYLDVPAAFSILSKIDISASPSGAPRVLLRQNSAGFSISLSHSNGIAACAISDSDARLGCDLEAIEPRSNAFVADYFTADEHAFLLASPLSARMRLVNLIWSAKESTLKALEEGLRLDTRSVTVSLDCRRSRGENGWYPLYVRSERGRIFHGWYQCADDFARTLVGAPQPEAPTLLTLDPRTAHLRAIS